MEEKKEKRTALNAQRGSNIRLCGMANIPKQSTVKKETKKCINAGRKHEMRKKNQKSTIKMEISSVFCFAEESEREKELFSVVRIGMTYECA